MANAQVTSDYLLRYAPSISFGIVSVTESDRMRVAVRDFTRVLSEELHIRVDAVRFASYWAIERAFEEQQLTFGWLPPLVMTRLVLHRFARPVAQCIRGGQPSYFSCIVCREDSHYRNVSDVKMARMAWVDKNSAAGYVFPRLLLVSRGLHPDDAFASETFVHNHAEVIREILSGGADVGATFATFDAQGKMLRSGWTDPDGQNGRPVRILDKVGPIPNDAFAVHASLSEEASQTILGALMAVSARADVRSTFRTLFGADYLAEASTKTFASTTALLESALRFGAPIDTLGEPRSSRGFG